MYKYLLFIILGILIFILFNRYDGFSIGNQFMTTAYMNDASPPILVTTRDWKDPLIAIFDKIVKGQNFCMGTEFGACAMYMNDDGGSCQINSITGLYSSIGVKFRESDINYIRSFGQNLADNENTFLVVDYLRNRESMKKLLVENGLNPMNELQSDAITDYNLIPRDRLVEFNITITSLPRDIYITDNGTDIGTMGHRMLMYKTTISNMRLLVDAFKLSRVDDELNRKESILNDLEQAFEPFPPAVEGEIAVLIMDLCSSMIWILTDWTYPLTNNAISQDSDFTRDIRASDKIKWRVKINMMFLAGQNLEMKKFGFTTLNLRNLNLNSLNSPTIELKEWLKKILNRETDTIMNDLIYNRQNNLTKFFAINYSHDASQGDLTNDNLVFKNQRNFYGDEGHLCNPLRQECNQINQGNPRNLTCQSNTKLGKKSDLDQTLGGDWTFNLCLRPVNFNNLFNKGEIDYTVEGEGYIVFYNKGAPNNSEKPQCCDAEGRHSCSNTPVCGDNVWYMDTNIFQRPADFNYIQPEIIEQFRNKFNINNPLYLGFFIKRPLDTRFRNFLDRTNESRHIFIYYHGNELYLMYGRLKNHANIDITMDAIQNFQNDEIKYAEVRGFYKIRPDNMGNIFTIGLGENILINIERPHYYSNNFFEIVNDEQNRLNLSILHRMLKFLQGEYNTTIRACSI